MRNNGIVGGMYGLYKYKEYQILRVGPFNEQMKYHPVQVRVSDLMNNGETKYWILDCRISKNDYGDWEVRRGL